MLIGHIEKRVSSALYMKRKNVTTIFMFIYDQLGFVTLKKYFA